MLMHPLRPRRQHRPRGHAAPGAPRHLSRPAAGRAASPSSPAPTASRCTCARTAATSRTTTCERMRAALQTRMNLEMAATDAMIAIARRVRPQDVCLVPERREELTTEGGLDVAGQVGARSRTPARRSREAGIRVSLFIDPDPDQLEAALEAGAPVVELHTGAYAETTGERQAMELCAPASRRRATASRIGLDGARRPRPALPQRAAGGGDPRDRRAEHRPRHRGACRVRRHGRRGARDEGPDDRRAARPGPALSAP